MFGFIGCGKMGSALLEAWLEAGILCAAEVSVADPHTAEALSKRLGVQAASVEEVLGGSEEILLGIKPQQLSKLSLSKDQLVGRRIFSILAGTPLTQLKEALPEARLIRIMPNISVLKRAGVSLILERGGAEELRRATQLFSAVGQVELLSEESLFSAGTALTGCGPAYFALMVEAMADGAVALGLSRTQALRMAAATARGASLLMEEGMHPALLKDAVCSPAGMSIRGVQVLETRGFRGCVIEAILAAEARSLEMER